MSTLFNILSGDGVICINDSSTDFESAFASISTNIPLQIISGTGNGDVKIEYSKDDVTVLGISGEYTRTTLLDNAIHEDVFAPGELYPVESSVNEID